MLEPYIGGIVLFAGTFAPRGWAFCNGQLLAISQNSALFAILGTTYGGNGVTTFALPDLRGRVPVSQGQGPGLSNYTLGEQTGTETVTLLTTQMPAHNHTLQLTAQVQVASGNPTTEEAADAFLTTTGAPFYASSAAGNDHLGGVTAAGTSGISGGSQPFDNRSPYLGLNYIIALQGIFPSRN